MHSAPSVSYPVGRSRFHVALIVVASLGGLLAGLLWRQQAAPGAWMQLLFGVTWLAASGAAWQNWLRSPSGSLAWDGKLWRCSFGNAVVTGHIGLQLDWQRCLLLRLRADQGRDLWLWPERGRDRLAWDALRRAALWDVAASPNQAWGASERGLS